MTKITNKRYCAIIECVNSVGTDNREIAFFKPPSETTLKDQWVQAIKGLVENNVFSGQFLLCQNHFESILITRRKDRTILRPGSIPTIFGDEER